MPKSETSKFTSPSEKKSRWSWILVDVGNSAFATTISAAIFPVYLPSLLPKDGIHFSIAGLEWTSTALSLWAYTVSFSIFITFLISPFLGAWADEGGHRKRLLGIFTVVGAVATASLALFDDWRLALLCFVIGNIGFSASCVFYNSLLENVAEEKDWHKVSLQGFAWGYIGGGILLAINLLTILKYEWFGLSSKVFGLKLSFISVGIWWLGFTLPCLLYVSEEKKLEARGIHQDILKRFKDLWSTLASLPKLPNLLLFMVAFAFFNEGISTVISMSSLFGKEVLNLKDETLIGTLLLIQFLGLPLTLSMDFVAKRFGPKKTLLSSLGFWLVIVSYAYFMTHSIEFWILGVLVSIVLGVSQSIPRSVFASLVPPGKQAEYFSFFALSGKMTSVLGPLTFGLVRDSTGNPRISILSIGIFFILGLILMSFVSIDPQKTNP